MAASCMSGVTVASDIFHWERSDETAPPAPPPRAPCAARPLTRGRAGLARGDKQEDEKGTVNRVKICVWAVLEAPRHRGGTSVGTSASERGVHTSPLNTTRVPIRWARQLHNAELWRPLRGQEASTSGPSTAERRAQASATRSGQAPQGREPASSSCTTQTPTRRECSPLP